MSKVYTQKFNKKVKDQLRTIYILLPTLKTPDINEQNHWRRNQSF